MWIVFLYFYVYGNPKDLNSLDTKTEWNSNEEHASALLKQILITASFFPISPIM